MRIARNNTFSTPPKTGEADTDKALLFLNDQVNRIRTEITRGLPTGRITATATTQTLVFQHKLGRNFVGWMPMRVVGGTPTTFHESTSQPFPDRELRIDFAGTVGTAFELWIF